MSVPVALEELARRVEEFGPHAFLVTSGADARPHVVSVAVEFDAEVFSLSAGRTSIANIGHHPSATLLWPGTGGPYSLIVDGRCRPVDDAIVVEPTRAVLHRLAGAPNDLPTCVPIERGT
jgi:hypothetical protein